MRPLQRTRANTANHRSNTSEQYSRKYSHNNIVGAGKREGRKDDEDAQHGEDRQVQKRHPKGECSELTVGLEGMIPFIRAQRGSAGSNRESATSVRRDLMRAQLGFFVRS